MIDFKELPVNGDDFELLVRELLHNKGLEVYWSGKGADGGKDLLCIEKHKSCFKSSTQRWLVQCKHNAHAGRAVGKSDLDSIVDSCAEHNATGFLLVCSTFPSSSLVKRMEEIQNTKGIITQFWDCRYLERELLKPTNWSIANMFFPKSLSNCGWNISAIEPSFWHASYRGNILYIATRVGTNCNFILTEIEERIRYINHLKLKKGHIVRVRAMYFDDKHTNFTMYLDYLYPVSEDENVHCLDSTVEELEKYEIIDGVSYRFDIMSYRYQPYSDSFDKDSNSYYSSFLQIFKSGLSRKGERKYVYSNKVQTRFLTEDFVDGDFNSLLEALKQIRFITILKSTNAKVEFIDQFTENFVWSNLISTANYNIDNFFNVQIRFVCSNFDLLVELLSVIPQSVNSHFELVRNYVFLPDEGLDSGDELIYTLHLSVHPVMVTSKYQFRKSLNKYLREVRKKVDEFNTSQNN